MFNQQPRILMPMASVPTMLARGLLPPAPLASYARSPGGSAAEDARRATRSVLTDIFPETQTIQGGFDNIAIPGGFSVPAGSSAWFPLVNFAPDVELSVFAVSAQLESTNNSDQGALPDPVTQSAWGSHTGRKAAIVVGYNLPIVGEPGVPAGDPAAAQWSTSPCLVPSLISSTIAVRQTLAYFWVTGFPPGSQRDAIPFRDTYSQSFVPYVMRIPFGQRLQAALVIDGAQAQAGAGLNVVGFGLVRIALGLTHNISAYTGE